MATQSLSQSPDVLNSWKEIARYLDRGVRTVQRWEADLGLPVRRPRGRGRSAVFAFRIELDAWLKSCPKENRDDIGDGAVAALTIGPQAPNGTSEPGHAPNLEEHLRVLLVTRKLIDEGLRIRKDSRETRAQLKDAVSQLRQTLGKMSFSAPPRSGKFKLSFSAAAEVNTEDSSPEL